MIKKGHMRGSITVEACFVMFLVLGVIFLVIRVSFFMYDRCLLAGGGYEAVVWKSHLQRMDEQADLERGIGAFLGEKLVLLELDAPNEKSSSTDTEVFINAEGSVGGILATDQVLTDGTVSVSVSQHCPIVKHESIIRKTRKIAGLWENR